MGFEDIKYQARVEDEAVADLFEWDETVAYEEEAQYVGRIGRKEEGGVQLEAMPKPYWENKELLEEKNAGMLAPRRTFNHTINLKVGPNLPYAGIPANSVGKIQKPNTGTGENRR